MTSKNDFECMVNDFVADHTEDNDWEENKLEIKEIYVNENGEWEAYAEDATKTYTLLDNGLGDIIFGCNGSK